MKTMQIITRLFLMTVLMGLASCSGEDGEDGAIGPQGAQGEQGAPGPQGAQGPQGETGTANVVYSDWIARDFETAVAAETNQQELAILDLADFDQDEDIILVYGRRPANAVMFNVYQLPHILASQQEYYGFGLFPFTGGSTLSVVVSTLDGGTNLFTFFADFRYIIVPGGNPLSGKSKVDFAKMSYEEVVTYLNIPE
jgi:hypothetical protein